MKRFLMIAVSTVLIAAMLCACGGGGSPAQTTAAAGGETKAAEVTTAADQPAQTEAASAAEETKEETQPAQTEAASDELTKEKYGSMTKEELLELADFKDPESLTVDEFCWLVETYRFVDIDYDAMTFTTKDTITAEALKDVDKAKPAQKDIIPALLKSEYPQARAYAYDRIATLFGVSDADLKAVLDTLDSEDDPYCLMCATSGLSNEMAKDPAVADFIFKMSESDNSYIRRKAAIAIGNSWSIGVDGTVERIIEMMQDEDEDVAKLACSGAGNLHDDAVVEPIVNILNDPSKASIHGEAVRGLSYMWLNYPYHKQTSEAAYRATLDYYSKTPRDNTVPAWNGIAAFNTVAANDIGAWYEIATFFNADEFYGVMADYIAAPDANWLGKSPAMKAIKALCPEKFADLEEVIAGIDDTKVKDAYEKEKAK